jgi:LysM repeat protein
MGRRAPGGAGRAAVAGALSLAITICGAASSASAAVPHVVAPGESLWSIAAANNFTTASVAAYNGLGEDAWLYAGETIQIPSADEVTVAAPATSYGLATISGPLGAVQLDATAAAGWESMRYAALSGYGVDLYPNGTLSGYRSYEQQAYLYDLFLSGVGAPANPPGTSSHELGTAVDVAEPVMRDVIDQIGPTYGWYGIQSEWWHVEYWG